MLLTILVGCEKKNAEELLAKAGLQMLDKSFAMTMTMDFSCADAELDEAFAAISDTETVIIVDGKNVKMDMTVLDQRITVLCVNNIVYMDMFGMKIKSFLTDEHYAEMFGEVSEMSDMELDKFESVDVQDNADGGKTIACKGFSEEFASAVVESAADIDGVLNIDVDDESSGLTIVLDKDGNFASISVDITMIMLIKDKDYVSVDASVDYAFDYTKGEELTYPADADQYGTIDPDHLTE
jgi:hypothetical protein